MSHARPLARFGVLEPWWLTARPCLMPALFGCRELMRWVLCADVRLCVVWLGRWTDVLSGFNTAFVIIFAVEALMKIIAFGLRL
jgi:hypothetical protein